MGAAAVPWAWADKEAFGGQRRQARSVAQRGAEQVGGKGRNVGAIVCPVELNLKKRYAVGNRECYSPTSTLPATTRTGKYAPLR